MSVPVKLNELADAVDWVSAADSASLFDCNACVSRTTGTVHWQGEGVDEELPEDIEDDSLYSRLDQLDAWHAYEQAAVEAALADWCSENGFSLVP